MKKIHQYHTERNTHTEICIASSWKVVEDYIQGLNVAWVIDAKLLDIPYFQSIENKIVLVGGEATKTFDGLKFLLEEFQNHSLDRTSIVVCVGGGSISDLVGFACSIYLRGIAYILIPSTLLSLIDASIGGKNGINFLGKKNQLGTIHQPKTIIYFHPLIARLPIEDLADGFAEIIKYATIMDSNLFDLLDAHHLDSVRQNEAIFSEIIHRCIIHKSSIVEKDTYELGIRRILNFGHTIGHGIETNMKISHGKSVGLGMLFAAKLSEIYFQTENYLHSKIARLLEKYHLPTTVSSFDAEAIFNQIMYDKKRDTNKIHFVLIRDIGLSEIGLLELDELSLYLKKAEIEGWMLR